MAAALRSFYFCMVFSAYCFSLALAEDDSQFIYNGFAGAELQLFGASVHDNGLLQLTNTSLHHIGHAFCRFPIKFNTSSSQSLSFSTNFVFAIVPGLVPGLGYSGGHGLAFVISPSMDFSGAVSDSYLGLFNISTNGLSTNHILAFELDTLLDKEFQDIDYNHVGIDVNNLITNVSAPAAYFPDEERKRKNLSLQSGNPIQMWIDYSGAEKLINVTLAPIGIPKPRRALLSTSIDLSKILLDTMYVGFSAATGALVSDHYILGWSFNKTGQAQDLDISNLPQPPPPPPLLGKTSVRKRWRLAVIAVGGLAATIVIGIILVILFFFFMRWRRARFEEKFLLELMNEAKELEIEGRKGFKLKVYSGSSIMDATNCFSDENKLGEGDYGPVYKGLLDGQEIAIKKVIKKFKTRACRVQE